jgi:BirA family transcriptional regulator, biotin operon repressor / biotin---[acetyl-CoA-carboxylase] ligase
LSFFKKVIFLETIDSTNSYLKNNKFDDRTIIYTFNQTKGRGRVNRNWIDFKDKNLALSILFLPQNKSINTKLGIAAISISLIEALRDCKIYDAWIKWPNDIYVGEKKISGILAESIWRNELLEKFIIGIGVNINLSEEDLSIIDKPATSILYETGELQDMNKFVTKFIKKLSGIFSILYKRKDIRKIKKMWLSYSRIIGKQVNWNLNGIKKIGTVVDIDNEGSLILNIDGQIFNVVSGDIELI